MFDSLVQWGESHVKRESNENLSGNEVYFTECSFVVIFKNS